MKKLFSIASLALLAASMLMTGCKKDNDGNIFHLKIQQYQGQNKTTLGDNGATLWVNGDQVYVNGAEAANIAIVSVSSTGATAEVTGDPVNGKYYFFYPGNCTVTGFEGNEKSFTYTMPSEFTFDANALKAPMAGVSNGQEVTFANLCTMLKLEFLKIPTSITITSENTAISGEGFTASYNGSSWTVTAPAATDDNKTITISNNNYMPYVYVPLPAGNHKLTITATNVDTKEMSSSVEMEKNTIYPIHFAHPFSVSDTKKVYFSPGNLQYKGNESANNRWRFAQYQWAFVGSGNLTTATNPAIVSNNWIDLFSWASSGANLLSSRYSISPTTNYTDPTTWPIKNLENIYSNISATQFDWGHNNPISNGGRQTGMWFTLTKEEWAYLVGRNGKCGLATLQIGSSYYKGLVILPDDFTIPESLSFNSSTSSTSSNDYLNNQYEESVWLEMEKNGAVFLPGAGYRWYSSTSKKLFYNFVANTALGYYWASTLSSTIEFHSLQFGNFPSGIAVRTGLTSSYLFGCSVRLVRDAN